MSRGEDDYLPLSGLQHFAFCRRQWALIHLENLWAENLRTTEGALLHERAHDASVRERRGDLLILRGVRVSSDALGVSGTCDVLELHADPAGVTLAGTEGRWRPYPVEYKRGHAKESPADRLQLCAQAMCLEEMLCCDIPEGALFYGETRRRETVPFTLALRQQVQDSLAEMHALYRRGHTPKVRPGTFCNACSLKPLCLPKLLNKRSAAAYLAQALEEAE
ncbi:MAG: CRISPR-associated protein Cas4 [Oscillospiraceae bacterium]|nr:CRISPR-associated protein Cas4 [Oscillospiraceae bacterium]